MKIFGLTITRTSKCDMKDLDIFKKAVDGLRLTIEEGLEIVDEEPGIDTVQNLARIQEQVESHVEIYNNNKFSKPATMFRLSELTTEMREVYLRYAQMSSNLARIQDDIDRINNIMRHSNDEVIDNKTLRSIEMSYKRALSEIAFASKQYEICLNAFLFTITYDITRIDTGVDIIKEYYDTNKNTVPKNGFEYIVKFKKLSRDEINEQASNLKEDE